MSRSLIDSPPSPLLRAALRLPVWLYRIRLGRLLGDRFLLLKHTGRKSGRIHETVIEVVKHDALVNTYYVVSGWGARSDWYLNIQKNPAVTISVGGRTMTAHAVEIAPTEATEILCEYADRNRLAFRELTRLFLGETLQPGLEAAQRLAERMPMVAFHGAPRPLQ